MEIGSIVQLVPEKSEFLERVLLQLAFDSTLKLGRDNILLKLKSGDIESSRVKNISRDHAVICTRENRLFLKSTATQDNVISILREKNTRKKDEQELKKNDEQELMIGDTFYLLPGTGWQRFKYEVKLYSPEETTSNEQSKSKSSYNTRGALNTLDTEPDITTTTASDHDQTDVHVNEQQGICHHSLSSSSSSSPLKMATQLSLEKLHNTLNSVSDQFECSICFEYLAYAVTTPCGHTFCFQCLKDIWEGPNGPGPGLSIGTSKEQEKKIVGASCTCPLCANPFNILHCNPTTAVDNIIETFLESSETGKEMEENEDADSPTKLWHVRRCDGKKAYDTYLKKYNSKVGPGGNTVQRKRNADVALSSSSSSSANINHGLSEGMSRNSTAEIAARRSASVARHAIISAASDPSAGLPPVPPWAQNRNNSNSSSSNNSASAQGNIRPIMIEGRKSNNKQACIIDLT